jgi:ABC-type amino acid transport system permease subunit
VTAAPTGTDRQPVGTSKERKGRVDQVIETMASGLGDAVGALASSGVLFVVFAVLWAAFAVGLLWSQGSVDAAWQSIRDLPLLVQAVVWLLFLPVMAGLWIWETSWPLVVRLVLVVGLAGWNLLVMMPSWLTNRG